MNPIASIALSGMTAASERLAVSARNVADASTDAAPLRADQVEIAGGGTAVQIGYGPPASNAVATGGAQIDLASEAVDQLAAGLAFAANVAVLRASSRMTRSLLDVMA